MQRRTNHRLLGGLAVATTVALASTVAPAPPAQAAKPPAQAATDDFIMGTDLGMLAEVEDLGGTFSQDGVPGDAVEILAGSGANLARLRLWVDPYTVDGEPYGGGTNDLATTIAMAQRAKAEGMDVMLDFHLSDWWADPGTQTKPKEWRGLAYADLVTTVHDYTEDVITQMRAAGVLPDMVQMGNEITGGVLWDDGRVGGTFTDFGPLAELLTAGFDGVDDALAAGEDVERVLALDWGGDNPLYRWWFDAITAEGVDFDVIGLSYYPFWHGTMGELAYNLNDISQRYDKDVLIVETAYGWTLGDGDGLGNSFYTAEEATGGYPATVAGQTAFLRDLVEIVQDVPGDRGRGIVWWEPAWLPVPGANWGTEAGKEDNDDTGLLSNPWDNQTLFDWDGEALDTLDVFGDVTQPVNHVVNGDFEADGWTSTPTGWSVWGATTDDATAVFTQDPAVVGGFKLVHWKDTAYEASTYQTVTGLANGTYRLTAWVLNGGGQDTAQMYVKGYGGAERVLDLPVSASAWTKITIDGIAVTTGQAELGFYSDAAAGTWINVDNVKLTATS